MIPSQKPKNHDMSDLLELHFRKELLDVDDMLPARIVSYDRAKNRAQIEILYLVTMMDSSVNPMAAPAEVPVMTVGGGGMVLTFPYNAGDLGWVKSNDRDISLFLQEYSAQPGNTPRLHSFEDAVFIPDVMRGWVVQDGATACLQTLDGATRIAIKPGEIKLAVGGCVMTITDSGITSNKPITAPQGILGGINMVGHVHTNPEGGNVGPAKNP